MTVLWTRLAEQSYRDILEHLEEKWPAEIVIRFIYEVDLTIKQVRRNPELFQCWKEDPLIRKGFVNEYVAMYYELIGNNLVLHIFWSNSRKPEKLKKILKV